MLLLCNLERLLFLGSFYFRLRISTLPSHQEKGYEGHGFILYA